MDNFYNSSDLCCLPKKNTVNVAGTLQLNRKNVSVVVKDAELKQGEHTAVQSEEVMMINWTDKKPTSFI
jgi:hypothetical protein